MKILRHRTCLSFFFAVCVSLSLTACASAQDYSSYDLSTVERVNAAREAKLGKKLDRESKGCVRLPEELPGIILLGSFAYDRGCELSGAIINKREFSIEKDFSKMALESLGWKNAGADERRELALKWVRSGLLAFETSLTQATADFAKQQFQAPQAQASADGGVTVSLWISRAPGMRCERGYDKLSYRFLQDGTLGKSSSENSFTVPCR